MEQLWDNERIKQRADEIDTDMYGLHGGNTRPWQHYMEVWKQIAYEVRDDLTERLNAAQAERDALRQELVTLRAQGHIPVPSVGGGIFSLYVDEANAPENDVWDEQEDDNG